jgi:acetylornithine deacetylase/succinyl-diaminopimelate desuccinylase-like protein
MKFRGRMIMYEKAVSYIEQNKERFLEELKSILQIPSVSADSRYKDDVIRCAQWLVKHLGGLGLDSRLIETKGHPIVLARTKGKSKRELLIYGHYDVQPTGAANEWKTEPFNPVVKDGFIYARGATDDKGQLFTHIKAVESLVKTAGEFPCGIIFLIEGEEECGGDNLAEYIKKEKRNLAADAIVISDTSMYDEKTPAITYGLRGIVALEVKVKTAAFDLHSGVYGGAVGNPAAALSHILSRCIGLDGKIQVPGFYDDVKEIAEWEKQNIEKLKFDDAKLAGEIGVKKIFGDLKYKTLERLWVRPTFEINGIFGGYAGEGMKTIIPAFATAKITIRLVPDQKPDKVVERVKEYIKRVCPDFAYVEIEGPIAAAEPVLFDVEQPMIRAGRDALKKGFGAEPVFIRTGGSIPVVNTFWHELKKPVILMGFGLDSDGAHSVNERFSVENFIRGIKTSAYLLTHI